MEGVNNNQNDSNRTKLEVTIFRFIKIKTEGYDAEDSQRILEVIIKSRSIWILLICLLVLGVLSCLSGHAIWNVFQEQINPP